MVAVLFRASAWSFGTYTHGLPSATGTNLMCGNLRATNWLPNAMSARPSLRQVASSLIDCLQNRMGASGLSRAKRETMGAIEAAPSVELKPMVMAGGGSSESACAEATALS